jgi:hypothetical protein
MRADGRALGAGSYSYVAVGASGRTYDQLAAPVRRRVLFAGEHTCKVRCSPCYLSAEWRSKCSAGHPAMGICEEKGSNAYRTRLDQKIWSSSCTGFTGEGCTGAQEHPDTVGGAMLTGVREAVRALSLLRGDDARFGAAAADDIATGPLVKRRMVRVGPCAVLVTLLPLFALAGWCRPRARASRAGVVGASLCASLQVCTQPAVGLPSLQAWGTVPMDRGRLLR